MRFFFLLIIVAGALAAPLRSHASSAVEIEALIAKRSAQIEELERLINQYEKSVDEKHKLARNVSEEIAQITADITKASLEIKSLTLAIGKLDLEVKKTEIEINLTELKIDGARASLRVGLASLGAAERQNPVMALVRGERISSLWSELYDLYFLQSMVQRRLGILKDARKDLTTVQSSLEDARVEQEQLKRLQELARVAAEKKKLQQKKVLSQAKKEEGKIKEKIKVTKLDIARIREQITYLIRAGISVEEAIRYGQLSAIRMGIRSEFLIAVLEIESRLGQNVGRGTWKKDMAPRDHEAFLQITSKLHLDPDKTPVSKKPGYGWGGAMGPAQFIPTTWLSYEAEVAKFTGHNPPSPWNIEDAFTAAAIKLARQGATSKTREGEMAAAKAYISGSASCTKSICNYYARAVLDKARDLASDLNSNGNKT